MWANCQTTLRWVIKLESEGKKEWGNGNEYKFFKFEKIFKKRTDIRKIFESIFKKIYRISTLIYFKSLNIYNYIL